MSNGLENELIRASAGTGKTYQLTNRYLRLLRIGERPDEILATTFTRKAAGEILDRVLLRLAKAATDDGQRQELATAFCDDSLTQDDCLNLLRQTCRHLHRLRIGTLDSFFAQLAGSFALELGFPPGWRIAEEHVDAALRAQAVDAVLDGDSTQELLTLVHALTLGETTRSLQREVRDKVNSLYSVFRDSEEKAWHSVPRSRQLDEAQLADAVETLRTVPLPEHKSWHKNHAKDVEAAEADDWAEFVRGGLVGKVAAGESSYFRKLIEPPVAAAYVSLIDHARAVLLNQLADQTEATYRLLNKFHQQYQRLKSQARAMRFEDVTFQLAEAADLVNTEDVALRLDGHLRHLLLDEFQDTSLAQWTVVRPFAKQTAARPSSFFCVGDVKQAIYGWRGGVAEIFNAVKTELSGIVARPLDTNWRSSPRIVEVINRLFTRLDQHNNLGDLAVGVAGWQSQFKVHETAVKNESMNGYVALQASRIANDDELDLQKEITLRFAAEQVACWKQQAPGYEIGVLVRRNDAVRRLIYELRELGIEASEEGGSSLDDSAAVRLILSLVALADHPGDRVAQFHLATSPLAPMLRLQPAAVGSEADGNAASGKLGRRVRRQLMDNGYGRTIYEWVAQLASSCNRRELRRLEKLIGLAYQYDVTATTRPCDFLAYVDSQKVRDPLSADVRVMTVHQAKGLEFDIVVLADLEAELIGQRGDLVVGRSSPTERIDRVCRRCGKEVKQLLPESWQRLFRIADEQDLAESLCVLYVAVTRARHALHMILQPSAPNERTLHKTFGGLLRAALTDGEKLAPLQLAFEHGRADWFKNPGVRRASAETGAVKQRNSLGPIQVRLAPPTRQRQRGLERVSPSGLEGGTHVRLADTWNNDGAERKQALQRGTLIHAWFEQIRWLDDGRPADDRLRQIARDIPDIDFSSDQIDQALIDFNEMLKNPNIANCLRRDDVSPAATGRSSHTARIEARVSNERPIAVRRGDQLMVGSIDRLVTSYQAGKPVAAEIIDYKTDGIAADDPSALQKKIEYYRPQISAYRQAVEQILGLDARAITAKLVFVRHGIVREL